MIRNRPSPSVRGNRRGQTHRVRGRCRWIRKAVANEPISDVDDFTPRKTLRMQ